MTVLTGNGTLSLNSPCWLECVASPIASTAGTGTANPLDYFGMALLRFGWRGFYYPPVSVDGASVLIPCPHLVDSLGYAIPTGTTLTVTEVACLYPLVDSSGAAILDSAGNPLEA